MSNLSPLLAPGHERCQQMMAAASFCGGGILERHPNLRAAFLEGNCSWLPFLMWRMDEHWERTGDVHAPELQMAPSAYWKRQCCASAEADGCGSFETTPPPLASQSPIVPCLAISLFLQK